MLIKKASPLDVLMTRMIAKEKQHEMMIGVGQKKKKFASGDGLNRRFTPFLNYKCESRARVETEPEHVNLNDALKDLRNKKPRSTGTVADCQTAKVHAMQIVQQSVIGVKK